MASPITGEGAGNVHEPPIGAHEAYEDNRESSPDTNETEEVDQEVAALTEYLSSIDLDKIAPSGLINTMRKLKRMLDSLEGLPTEPPSLYFDIEGVNLSRKGTVSILQLYVSPTKRTYLIDVHVLGMETFRTKGASGRNLLEILETPSIPKVFFDVRNDSDALYSHFMVELKGVHDLQLMEYAGRPWKGKRICGLARCMREMPLEQEERQSWQDCKDLGKRLFAPESGGSYELFNERPMTEDIMKYCMQDVQYLARLWKLYRRRLSQHWWEEVQKESASRVKESQSPNYLPQGSHKTLAPESWRDEDDNDSYWY